MSTCHHDIIGLCSSFFVTLMPLRYFSHTILFAKYLASTANTVLDHEGNGKISEELKDP